MGASQVEIQVLDLQQANLKPDTAKSSYPSYIVFCSKRLLCCNKQFCSLRQKVFTFFPSAKNVQQGNFFPCGLQNCDIQGTVKLLTDNSYKIVQTN